MIPAALRALARVLGVLLPWRQHGRRRPTPSPHVRLGVHREPLLWRRRRRAHFATNGSAPGARCGPCPSPLFRPGGRQPGRYGPVWQGRRRASGRRPACPWGDSEAPPGRSSAS